VNINLEYGNNTPGNNSTQDLDSFVDSRIQSSGKEGKMILDILPC